MPQYVFINGERMELLEDRRFAMFPRFTEGTELFDPSTTPARPVPLSSDVEDLGVTTRKLVPNRHYFARNVDGTPANVALKYLIVHNVPANLTARDLGQFFENYSQVAEADILRWPGGNTSAAFSKGRGYVALQSAEAMVLLAKERSIYFDPMDTYLFVEPTDRHPANITHHNTHFQPPPLPPPTYDQGGASGHPQSQAPPMAGPRSMGPTTGSPGSAQGPHGARPMHQQGPGMQGGMQQGGQQGRGGPIDHQNHYQHQRGPAIQNSDLNSMYYFVDRMHEDHANYSHQHGVFWPNPANRKEYLLAASRGTVFVCFLLLCRSATQPAGEPHLYGYTRICWPQPVTEGTRLRGEVAIDWLTFGTLVARPALQQRLGVNVCGMSEGTPLKPELGQSIAEFIDSSPQNATLPRDRTGPPPVTREIEMASQQPVLGNVGGYQQPGTNSNIVAPRSIQQQQQQQGHLSNNNNNNNNNNAHAPMGMNNMKKNVAGGVGGAPPPHNHQQQHNQQQPGAGPHQHNNSNISQKRSQAGGPPPPLPRNQSGYNNSHHGGGSGYSGAGAGPPAVPLPASVAAAQRAAAAAAAAAKPQQETPAPASAAPGNNNPAPSSPPAPRQSPGKQMGGSPPAPRSQQVQQQAQEQAPPPAPATPAPTSAPAVKESPKEDYPALPGM